MRRSSRRHFSRTALTTGVTVATVITGVIGVSAVLPSAKPRSVKVFEAAAINPLNTTIGFADADIYGMSQADVDKTADKWVAAGVKTVRIMIPWAGVEATKGQLNWSTVDKQVNSAITKNMSIMGFINSTPGWAVASGAMPISGRPASPAAYGDFAAKVADRYKGKISAYEIWNEPNGITFYTPKPDPAGYTDLLKAAYPRIKAVDPSAMIIGGVLGAVIDYGDITINSVKFVDQMYAAGASGYFDALSYHPYHYKLKFSDGVTVANSPVNQLMQMRHSMVANGDSEKKIWGTEYGEPTSQINEAGQAAFISDILTKWQELPYTGPLYVYTTRDRKTGSSNTDDTYGVYRTDWTPKPAQQVLTSPPGKSAEYTRFAAQTDSALGEVLSPVFRATPTVWAQFRTVSSLYETPSGFVATPTPVATSALPKKATPTTVFANGYQDFTSSSGNVRYWYSDATGAHWTAAASAAVWKPDLGLAITDPFTESGGTRTNFEHGYIIWKPWVGAKVFYT